MPSSELYRRTLFFLVFAGIVIIVLMVLPFVETGLQEYVLARFGLGITPEGQVIHTDGTAPAMMTITLIGVGLNIFHIVKIVLWMALVIAIVRYVWFLVMKTAFRGSGQTEISSLLKTVISIVVYIVAFFIVFQSQYPNVQLAPLFTGSTIIGIVVGLALQDTLGNLFAGIALQADQPFQVGDVVSLSSRQSGVIESVSWRGVKIRTFQNKLLVISNSMMGKEAIEVAPKNNLNARLVFFNTLYTNSPAKTIQAVREAVRHVENVSQKIRPIVRIRNLGDNGIDWEIKYWAEDYTKYNDTDALVRQRVWYVFNREKLDFAFPTRTVYMHPLVEEPTHEEFLNQTVETLGRIPIFSPLSDDELERLAVASKERVFAPGEAIVRRGQEGNSMFVIRRGTVDVQVLQGDEVHTINTLRESDYFGEMSLLTGELRTATVVATSETEVIQINKSGLKPIFEANPELVQSVSNMIEERRALLSEIATTDEEQKKKKDRTVIGSIRKFFGIRKAH